MTWRLANGPATLARYMALEGIEPFNLTARGVFANGVPPDLGATVTASVQNASDGELYLFGAALVITASGFGPSADAPSEDIITADLYLERTGARFTNRPVQGTHLFGTTGQPSTWPVPLILAPGTTLSLDLRFGLGGSQEFSVCFYGLKRFLSVPPIPVDVLLDPLLLETFRRYRVNNALRRVEPFWYALEYDVLDSRPAYRPEPRTVAVTEADFVCAQVLGSLWDTGAANYPAGEGVLLDPTVNEGETRLSDRPLPLRAVAGFNGRGFRLPAPLIVPRGASLSSLATVFHAGLTSYPVDGVTALTFSGVRIWS